jgi:type I restriction enzyme, S subunit
MAGNSKRYRIQWSAQFTISAPIEQKTFTCVPRPGEQKRIADWLQRKAARLDALVTKVRQAIDLLKELRTALISAAMTSRNYIREAPRP